MVSTLSVTKGYPFDNQVDWPPQSSCGFIYWDLFFSPSHSLPWQLMPSQHGGLVSGESVEGSHLQYTWGHPEWSLL